jgi:hypothetical protein
MNRKPSSRTSGAAREAPRLPSSAGETADRSRHTAETYRRAFSHSTATVRVSANAASGKAGSVHTSSAARDTRESPTCSHRAVPHALAQPLRIK